MTSVNASNPIRYTNPVQRDQVFMCGGTLAVIVALFFFETDEFSKTLSIYMTILIAFMVCLGISFVLPESGTVVDNVRNILVRWERKYVFFVDEKVFEIRDAAFVISEPMDTNDSAEFINVSDGRSCSVAIVTGLNELVRAYTFPNRKRAFAEAQRLAAFLHVPRIDWSDSRWDGLGYDVSTEDAWPWWKYAALALFSAAFAVKELQSPATGASPCRPSSGNIFLLVEQLWGSQGVGVLLSVMAALMALCAYMKYRASLIPAVNVTVERAETTHRIPAPVDAPGALRIRLDHTSIMLGIVGLMSFAIVVVFHEQNMVLISNRQAMEKKQDDELRTLSQRV